MHSSARLKRLLSGPRVARQGAAAGVPLLSGVDRLAWAACVAGGGSGAALILVKLFCL